MRCVRGGRACALSRGRGGEGDHVCFTTLIGCGAGHSCRCAAVVCAELRPATLGNPLLDFISYLQLHSISRVALPEPPAGWDCCVSAVVASQG